MFQKLTKCFFSFRIMPPDEPKKEEQNGVDLEITEDTEKMEDDDVDEVDTRNLLPPKSPSILKKFAPNSPQCPKSPGKRLKFVKSISINISDSEDSEDSDYSEEEIKGGSEDEDFDRHFSINKLRDRRILSLRRTGEQSNLRKKLFDIGGNESE